MPSQPQRSMSDQAIARWHRYFCEWRSVEVFNQALKILRSRAGDHFVDDRRLQWAREAYVAGKYSQVRTLKALRVVKDDPPDFEAMGIAGNLERYEVVEVLRPDRRRDQEMRRQRLRPRIPIHDPEEGWLTIEEALAAVDAQIESKAAMGYPEHFNLVLYINLGFLRGGRTEFRKGLEDRQARGHAKFSALHFVW